MLIDNFEQHFVYCVLNLQNASMSAMKWDYENFLWCPGFWICSMANNENPEMPEVNGKLSKLKTPIVNDCNY